MKAAALKSYGAKGQDVVDKNYAAIDRGGEYVQLTVKPEWANLPDDPEKVDNAPAFVKELVRPMNAQAGDLLKVSDFVKHETVDGSWMVGTAAYEKRGVEAFVPVWNKDNCIQCNQCAYICPHAAIRPFVLDENEIKGFAAADDTLEMKAIREAEAWLGPSIIIAYAPCINHGLKAKGGMGKSQAEEGKNPFSLDSKEPNWENFHDFLLGEVRYLSVKKAYPNEAEELFAEAQKMAQLRYKTYVRKSQENWED